MFGIVGINIRKGDLKMKDRIDKSRRGFLKGLSLGIAGGIIGGPGIVVSDSNGALQAAEGVSPRPYPPPATGHIAHVSLDKTVCVGCGTCELVCALTHDDASGPSLRRLWLVTKNFQGVSDTLLCHQCSAPECYFACPNEALNIDPKSKARYIDPDACEGCQACIESCPLNPPRINFDPDRSIAMKCDLCKDRDNGPACVEFCPQKALTFETDGDEK